METPRAASPTVVVIEDEPQIRRAVAHALQDSFERVLERHGKDIAAVVLDEFHERHLQTDVALGHLARLRRTTRPDLWVLPMFHCTGWGFPWGVTAVGGRHVCLRRVDPDPPRPRRRRRSAERSGRRSPRRSRAG